MFVVQPEKSLERLEIMNSYVPQRSFRRRIPFTGQREEVFIAQNEVRQVVLPEISGSIVILVGIGDQFVEEYVNLQSVIAAECGAEFHDEAVCRSFIGE